MQEKFETTDVEFDADSGIGRLTLNRPDSLNALNTQLRRDIVAGLERLEAENEEADGIALRVVIMEGAEGNFCAGADVNEFSEATPGGSSEQVHYDVIRDFPVPIIAKIRGYCLGGGLETALCCDFRFAHEDASLGFPEVALGIVPGAGGVQLVSQLANPSVAMEMAMKGEHLSGERADDLGIVNHAHGDDLDDAVEGFAETIVAKPPLSIQAIKESGTLAPQVGLNEGGAYDRKQFERLLETEDHEKGARAFAEDEYEPDFKGR